VPEGKGVSSSAAIEVATMQAAAAELGLALDSVELAILCQKVENLVVGAPCGVMDQMTSACGQQDRLLELLCQPAKILGSLPVPPALAFYGIDSGVRHAVSGADYGQVRVGAFMGYRMIAELEGFSTAPSSSDGQVIEVDDRRFGGFLANVPPALFSERYERTLPEHLLGGDFIERYRGTSDHVTRVEASKLYPVRAATAHPISEHFRVRVFAELLAREPERRVCELLGELMYQSHASYSACGLGCEGTDALVDLVREAGPESGLFGAKITGGGSGGTVAILALAEQASAVESVAARYAEQSGREPYVFRGSSPGAAQFGVYRALPAGALERLSAGR
jgi:L-arabinokinase